MTILQILPIPILSLLSWFVILGSLSMTMELSRVAFVVAHYLLDIAVFAITFSAYFSQVDHLSSVVAASLVVGSLITFEVIYWRFFNKGDTKLNLVVDQLIPSVLIFATIYLVGAFLP